MFVCVCVGAAAIACCRQFVATLEGINGQDIIPFHHEVDDNYQANFRIQFVLMFGNFHQMLIK